MKTSLSGRWDSEAETAACYLCNARFGVFVRKRHCRECGHLFCGSCCKQVRYFPGVSEPQKICDACVGGATRASAAGVSSRHLGVAASSRTLVPAGGYSTRDLISAVSTPLAAAAALPYNAEYVASGSGPTDDLSFAHVHAVEGYASRGIARRGPAALEAATVGADELVASRFAESRMALRRHRLVGRYDIVMAFTSVTQQAADDDSGGVTHRSASGTPSLGAARVKAGR
jgi:hypothetical protein